MNIILGLGLTLILGICVLVGALIVKLVKNSDSFLEFSISLGITVMVLLSLFELMPETLENINSNFNFGISVIIVIFAIVFGITTLRILDSYIPDHEIIDENKKSLNSNLFHIGIMSSIAIMIHNVIEGMAVYATFMSSMSLGVLVSIGVGIHNIAMGIVISSTLSKSSKSRIEKVTMLGLVTVSTLAGGILVVLNQSMVDNTLILGLLLSLTIGMLIYIVMFELLPRFLEFKNKNTKILGILLGMITMLVSFLI